jgi:uncharacterized protein (TIGR03086 family)
MELVEMYPHAHREFARVVGNVKLDQLDDPTPCTKWDVRQLINHVIGTCYAFETAVSGGAPRPVGDSPDFAGNDPAGAFKIASERLQAAWAKPGALDQVLDLPFGQVPAPIGMGAHMNELLTHGWDLASASHQSTELDAELCAAALAFAQAGLPEEVRGPGLPFQAIVEVDADAPVADQLAGFMGRAPAS